MRCSPLGDTSYHASFRQASLRRPMGITSFPKGSIYICVVFAHRQFFFPPVADRLSCSRLWSTPGGRPYSTAQVWALAEVRVTCSGGSKSRENWQVTTGGNSEHVKTYRRIITHVRGENNVRRVSHDVLLTSSTDCLATSCTCSSACARARVRLVLVLLCSFSSARVLVCAGVLEWSCSCSNCSSVGVCSSARVLVLVIECSSVGECSSARS